MSEEFQTADKRYLSYLMKKFFDKEDQTDDVDFIFLVVHGIHGVYDGLESIRDEFQRTIDLVSAMWFWQLGLKIHIEFVNWKYLLFSTQETVFSKITPETQRGTRDVNCESELLNTRVDEVLKKKSYKMDLSVREVLNFAAADTICYMGPRYGNVILTSVAHQLNDSVSRLKKQAKFRNAKVVLLGHSLGGVLLYELVSGIRVFRPTTLDPGVDIFDPREFTERFYSEPRPFERPAMSLSDVALDFEVSNCFLLGSPLAGFLSFAAPSVLFSPGAFQFPTDVRLYNIYHPQDPVAFRLEPLLYPQVKDLPPPVLLSYWRNNGRRNYYRWDKKWQSTRSSVGKGLQRVMSAIFGKDETPADDTLAYAKPKTDKRRRYGRLTPVYVEGSAPVPVEAMEIFRTTLAKCQAMEGKLLECSVTTTKDADTTSVGAINESSAWSLGTVDVEGAETESVASMSKMRLMDWMSKLSASQSHDCLYTPEDEIFNRLKSNGLNDATEMTSDVEEDNGPEDLPTRVDFCVQERLLEHYNSYLAYITSHFIYFSSKDVAFFILKELTDLRPKVCYSDLLLVLETAQQEARLASRAGSETASVDQG